MVPVFGSILVFALMSLAALAFNIWMLVDAVRRPETDFNPPNSRVLWIVGLAVGLLLSWIGLAVALVYYFMVRKPLQEGRPAQQIPGGSALRGSVRAGRHCTTCGDPLGTHSRFCQNCGTPVGEDR